MIHGDTSRWVLIMTGAFACRRFGSVQTYHWGLRLWSEWWYVFHAIWRTGHMAQVSTTDAMSAALEMGIPEAVE